MTNDTIVVLGFSSVGKSTFIRHLLMNVPECKAARPVYGFMFRSGEVSDLCPGDLLHLDLSVTTASIKSDVFPCVRAHRLFGKCLEQSDVTKEIVLVAPERLIRERIVARRVVGIGFGRDDSYSTYPVAQKLKALSELPLAERYDQWFQFLQHRRIDFEIVRTDVEGYKAVAYPIHARAIISGHE
ncbi:MAG: hypothetical protein JJU15_04870 [Pararhodobacter sp.]|nr:hypothetical protein [Pararhodobacter sp.]